MKMQKNQNMWNAAKPVLKGKFIALNQKKKEISLSNFYITIPEKEEQNSSK